jgi:PIN domain nuclease of toxin-antitoxin system
VRILLDTQCWLWMQAEPTRFSARTRKLIIEPANELLLSVASVWEIAIKIELGKLKLPVPIDEYVTSRLARQGVRSLPIEQAHALRVALLPRHHRDPFGRILIAQAQVEGVPILTSDRAFRAYDAKVIPA